MGTGAVSRYKQPAKVGICHVTKSFVESSGAESGYSSYVGYYVESRMFKNRDKQMTFIVRVRFSSVLFYLKTKIVLSLVCINNFLSLMVYLLALFISL